MSEATFAANKTQNQRRPHKCEKVGADAPRVSPDAVRPRTLASLLAAESESR